MKPWKTLATSTARGGAVLVLAQRDTEFAIRADGKLLMSSRSTGSERALAQAGCEGRAVGRLLIGGLGMGFTLRAALDLLGPRAEVTVAELSPAVVEWNRGVLAALAGAPLADPRVRVFEGDVREAYRAGPYDAILLDVDNGPTALAAPANDSLYHEHGLAQARGALRAGGVLVVWSAGPDQRFVKRLTQVGFAATTRALGRHTLFVAATGPAGGRRG